MRKDDLKKLIKTLNENPFNFTWINPKTIIKKSKIPNAGYGRFSLSSDYSELSIKKDEIITAISGCIVTNEEYKELKNLFPFEPGYKVDYGFVLLQLNTNSKFNSTINHACDPNVYIDGQVILRALRDIEPGEELYVDYATCIDREGIVFERCQCGSQNCRGTITGKDWEKHNLIEKYEGKVAWYILKKKLKF